MVGKAFAINEDEGQPQYHAGELRRILRALMGGGHSHLLGTRAGVPPHPTAVVTLSGTTVTVRPHAGVLYPAETSTDGPYLYEHPELQIPLNPADGSNPRRDIIVARVYDDDVDASDRREMVFEYLPGTPAASPSAPSTPAGATRYAVIDVPVAGSPTLTVEAPWAVAAGGILPVRSSAELPAAGRYTGLHVFDVAEGRGRVWNGSAWVREAKPGGWEDIVKADTFSDPGKTYPIESGRYDRLRVRLRGSLDATGMIALRLNADTTTGLHRAGWVVRQMSSGSVVDNAAPDGTVWNLGRWGSASNNLAWAELTGVNVSTNVSMDGGAVQAAAGSTTRTRSEAMGLLSENRLTTSLRVTALGAFGGGIDTCTVWIEGHLA